MKENIPELITLPNGLVLCLIHTPHYKVMHFELEIYAGSDFEKKSQIGISHFVEHLALEGNAKYPDKKAFDELLAEVGGSYNASTSTHSMELYVSVVDTAYEIALEYLFESATTALFSKKSIKTERKAILDEIHNSESSPNRKYADFWNKHRFAKNGVPAKVLGNKSTIKSLDRDALIAWYKEIFQPTDATLYVCGNILDRKKLIAKIKKSFGAWETTSKHNKNRTQRKRVYNTSVMKTLVESEHKQAFSNISFPTIKYKGSKRSEISSLYVIKTYLTHTQLGVLYKKLRDDLGLIYGIGAYHGYYTNADGLFEIEYSTFDSNLAIVNDIIFDQLTDLAVNGFDPVRVEKCKTLAINYIKVGNLSFSSVLGGLRTPIHWERKTTTEEELIESYKQLTVDDINKAYRKILNPKYISVINRVSDKKYIAKKTSAYKRMIKLLSEV